MGLLLVPVASLRARLFKPPGDEVLDDGLRSILEGLTEQIEAELRTELGAATGTADTFYVRESTRVGTTAEVRLMLTRGFCADSPTAVKVEVGESQLAFTAAANAPDIVDLRDATEATVDDADQYATLDLERGVVTIRDYLLVDSYVRVTYDSGFAADSAKTEQFDQDALPGWLKELAIALGTLEAQEHPLFSRQTSVRERRDQAAMRRLERKVERLLRRHVRYEPDALVAL